MNENNGKNGSRKVFWILGMLLTAVIITSGVMLWIFSMLNNKVDCAVMDKHQEENKAEISAIGKDIVEINLMLKELMTIYKDKIARDTK